MTISFSGNKLAGHENNSVGSWQIHYSVQGGSNEKGSFSGDSRSAYLPSNAEGDEVLALFQQAFERRLTFQVGFSVTRNTDNLVCWNGIHHKTSPSGGTSSFGYPDPTYLKRVKEELSLKGLKFDDISAEEKKTIIEQAKTRNKIIVT